MLQGDANEQTVPSLGTSEAEPNSFAEGACESGKAIASAQRDGERLKELVCSKTSPEPIMTDSMVHTQ